MTTPNVGIEPPYSVRLNEGLGVVNEGTTMNNEHMRDLVKEFGLDWQRGYTPGEPTNRYAMLITAAIATERERWVQAAAVAVQELAGCATWTQGGVTCQALRDLLGKAQQLN